MIIAENICRLEDYYISKKSMYHYLG